MLNHHPSSNADVGSGYLLKVQQKPKCVDKLWLRLREITNHFCTKRYRKLYWSTVCLQNHDKTHGNEIMRLRSTSLVTRLRWTHRHALKTTCWFSQSTSLYDFTSKRTVIRNTVLANGKSPTRKKRLLIGQWQCVWGSSARLSVKVTLYSRRIHRVRTMLAHTLGARVYGQGRIEWYGPQQVLVRTTPFTSQQHYNPAAN